MVKLSAEYVLQKCKTDSLKKIKRLDVWSGELTEVSIIKDMTNLEICSLSLNKIESLSYFTSCSSLQELYLRKNQVSDLFEVRSLI